MADYIMHKLGRYDKYEKICMTWKVPLNYTGSTVYARSQAWFLDGKLHREDGPAVMWSNGTFNWYLNGENYKLEEWFERICNQNQLEFLFKVDEFSGKIK